MTRKVLSLATVIGIGYVYFQGLFRYDDALFLLISNNLLINFLLLLISAGAVWLTFQKKFKSWQLFLNCSFLAIVLAGLGVAGIMFSSFDQVASSLFMPLDYIVLIELGIIYGICSLSYAHQPVPAGIASYLSVGRSYKLARLQLINMVERLAQPEQKPSPKTASRHAQPRTLSI